MTGKQPRYGSADQLRDIVWTLCHDVEVGEEAFMDDYEVMLVEALENIVANDTPQVDDFKCVEEIVSTYETDSETRNA